MVDLYSSVQYVADNIKSRIAILYSTGEDSSVLFHVMLKYFSKDQIVPVFLYSCKELSYKNNFIKEIEKLYGINIEYHLDYNVSDLLRREGYKVKKISYGTMLQSIRQEYDCEYVAIGWVKGESMGRACAMKTYNNGIDWRDKKLFPLHEWNKKDIRTYIKRNKISLAPECYCGFRNIDIFSGKTLLWLKHSHPEDYKAWVKTYPMSEAEFCE